MPRPGDRVLAEWEVNLWYPGVLLPGSPLTVQWDDGDRAELSPNQVRPLIVAPGQRIEGRWQGGGAFYEGIIQERQGDAVYIRYDDGDEEWTSISMLRFHTRNLVQIV